MLSPGDIPVLVPRRSGDEWRDTIWTHVRDQWAGHPIIEGHHDTGPFNRSAAINQAAMDAGDWQVAIIADADVLVPRAQAMAAAFMALRSGRLVLAYTDYLALTRGASRGLIVHDRPLGQHAVRWAVQNAVSGCLAVPRGLWDTVGGFDERFQGWGWEDRAFFVACDTLAGHARVQGPVRHVWHPRSVEKDQESREYQAGRVLCRRYKRAHGNPTAVRQLLQERVPA